MHFIKRNDLNSTKRSLKSRSVLFILSVISTLYFSFSWGQTIPTPVITGNSSFCAGTNTTLSTATVSGYSYCWQNLSSSTTWQNVGTAGFSAGRSFYQSLSFNGNTPYVAYQDEANGSKTSVMKFDGTNWVYVGNPAFSSGYSDFQNLSFIGNTPYVSFRDWGLNLNGKGTVMKFDGTNWVYVGNPGFTIGQAQHIKLVINAGIPYVAFQDEANNYKATVMKFDGANWVYVGNRGFSTTSVNWMSFAFNGNTPYLAFADGTNSSNKTTVMKFDGTNWVNVGNPQFTSGFTRNQSLAFDGTTPYVAFVEDVLNFKTSVMKFDGTNWVYVGNPGISAGSSGHVSLAINNNTPYVAYQDAANFDKTTVMKFNGASWVAVGSAGISSGFAMNQSLVFNGNTPYVAFSDEPTNYKTTVMKYEVGCVGTSNSIQINTPGTYTVTVTNSSGSATSSPVTVTGVAIPTVSCPGNLEVCSNAPVFTLTGGTPVGGVYSGPGVSNNQFNPASAGTGIKNITYTYTDPFTGCSNSCSFTITVDVTAPVITPISNNITLPLNANGTRTITFADIATVVDNCSVNPQVTISPSTFNCSTVGKQVITLKATDGTFGTPRNPSAALFFNPYDLQFDQAGNLIIAGNQDYKIRKLSASGIVSTLAGSGERGSVDGAGGNAQFYSGNRIAVDASGNTYEVDGIYQRIRKISPAGIVTNYTGGIDGYADGTLANARFSYPNNIAIDGFDNLYIVDNGNNRIRKITPAGIVSTFAGDALCGPEAYCGISAIGADALGNVYVSKDNKIRKITPNGTATWIAGTGQFGSADGLAMSATFASPWDITVDASGNIWISDQTPNKIRKITPDGQVVSITVNGSGFNFIKGLAVNSSGNLYFTISNAIMEYKPNGTLTLIAGSLSEYGSQDGNVGGGESGNQSSLQITVTITGNSTPVFSTTQANVLVSANASCQAVLANYISTASASSSCGGAVTISQNPAAGTVLSFGSTSVTLTATDASNNSATQTFTVSVTDNIAPVITPISNSTIINLNANGTATINASTIVSVSDCNPAPGVRISPSDFTCADIGNKTITIEATDGIFGPPDPSAVKFNSPLATAIDAQGNIFVADRGNFKIRKITPGGVVSTFADGYSAPQGTAGSFSVLSDMAIDNNGNLFLTDAVGNKVKKITPAGIISTFVDGFASPPGTEGRFSKLNAITVNSQGVIFVADNDVIKMISPAGVVTTLAGSTIGFADGTGAAAKFWGISGLATDADGNIYVADGANYRIRKVTPAGVVTTISGSGSNGFADGPASTALFGFLHAIVVDNNNTIYVTDSDNDRIRKISPTGIVSTFSGGNNDFALMTGLAIDASGNFIVPEITTHTIKKVSVTGNIATLAGTGLQGYQDGNISGITGNVSTLQIQVTIKDATAPVISQLSANPVFPLDANGSLTITLADIATVTDNCNNNPSVRFNPSTFTCSNLGVQIVTVEATDGSFSASAPSNASFNKPIAITTAPDGTMYVADRGSESIRRITPDGQVILFAGTPTSSGGFADGQGVNARFMTVLDLTTDAAGNIYVADAGNRRVRKITPGGLVTTIAGNGTPSSIDGIGTAASFESPNALTIDADGNIYVADASKIRKITPGGNVTTIAGSTAGFADGNGLAAKFWGPSGLTTDAFGNLYIADGANRRIRKMTPAAEVTTLAGGNNEFGFLDAIVRDASGDMYVCDSENHMIKKLSAAGIITVVAGSGSAGSADGTGISASFNGIFGMTMNGGQLYVSEFYNNKIREVTTSGVVSTFAGSGSPFSIDGNIGGVSGNYSSLPIQVTITDNTAPLISCPANITSPSIDTHPNHTGFATATDNCSNPVSITYTDISSPQSCFITRTWKATDASGNFSTCEQQIAVPQLNVSLGPNMYIMYGALGYNGCRTITPVITGGSGTYSYLWTSTDPSVNNATTATITPCINEEVSHTYSVTITSSNGCSASSSVMLMFIDISCSKNSNNEKVTICHLPDGNSSNCKTICVSSNAAQLLINNGSYYGKCLSNCEIPIQARIRTTENGIPFSTITELSTVVYPNPHAGNFNLVISSPIDADASVELFTVNGQKLLEKKVRVLTGDQNNVLFKNIGKGTLFYRVRVGGKVVTGKVIGIE